MDNDLHLVRGCLTESCVAISDILLWLYFCNTMSFKNLYLEDVFILLLPI
jgi:hypothetical protein